MTTTAEYCTKCKHAGWVHDGTNHAPGKGKTACRLCHCEELKTES